ncbi:MAG TPA: insulinase family protein, partial [Polyangiaceae bacterium]|nr:insulinase family protein [Polyangiaceae bacterium]
LSSFLLHPDFNEVEVDVQRRLALARIASSADSSWHFRDIVLAKIPGFERSSPKENAVRLLELKPPLLRRIHACTVRPDAAELVVVGPVSVEAVTAQAERAFDSWETAPPDATKTCEWPQTVASAPGETVQRLARTELQLVYGDNDPFITIAADGPSLESEDFLPFILLADVLEKRAQGSAKRLRHTGGTYGIWASVTEEAPGRSVLILRGQLDADVAQDALRALLQDIGVLSRVLDEGELESRKRAWRNELVTSMSSNMSLANVLLSGMARKREVTTLPDMPNEIMRIDAARCRDVAERWLASAHPSILVVTGKPRTFLRGLGVDAHVELKYFSAR